MGHNGRSKITLLKVVNTRSKNGAAGNHFRTVDRKMKYSGYSRPVCDIIVNILKKSISPMSWEDIASAMKMQSCIPPSKFYFSR